MDDQFCQNSQKLKMVDMTNDHLKQRIININERASNRMDCLEEQMNQVEIFARREVDYYDRIEKGDQ